MTATTRRTPPRVLLTNDDGPPSPHSPHVLGLWSVLREAGWHVDVVLPSAQKSWGSMGFSIHQPVSAWWYYPLANNHRGTDPNTPRCWSSQRRPVDERAGEVGEWVLLDGSPTTCANAGFFNRDLFFASADSKPLPPYDLVISGPNFGRNTGTAFALSSGTIGAALAASLAGVPAISLSYGHFQQPPPRMVEAAKSEPLAGTRAEAKELAFLAHRLCFRIVERLWSAWEPGVGVYAVNVPLGWTLREEKVYWTRLWASQYSQLFQPTSAGSTSAPVPPRPAADADSAKGRDPKRDWRQQHSDIDADAQPPPHVPASAPEPALKLRFAPVMPRMLAPESLVEGTDIWALMNGYVSVSRLAPNYAEVDGRGNGLAPADGEPHGAAATTADEAPEATKAATTTTTAAATLELSRGSDVGQLWKL